jgi:hypothetical protein
MTLQTGPFRFARLRELEHTRTAFTLPAAPGSPQLAAPGRQSGIRFICHQLGGLCQQAPAGKILASSFKNASGVGSMLFAPYDKYLL